MTEENKKLLLIDLGSRLLYGVIVRHADAIVDPEGNETGEFFYRQGYLYDVCRMDDMTTTIIESKGSEDEGYDHICLLERTLPYLRPMSSMTAEEYKEYDSKRSHICDEYNRYCFETIESIDWLLEHHFDFRGLLEKDLALEAPEGMY